MEEQPQIQPRQTAYIVQIKDLLNGIFIKESGWNPSYVVIGGKNVSRINIIGIITEISEENNVQTIVIEDGTGRIPIRNFEKKSDVSIGDAVLLIGRIRQYGKEKYVVPEVMNKNINKKWNLFWKKQVLRNKDEPKNQVKEVVVEEIIDNKEEKSAIEQIIEKIRELDDGTGALFEEIKAISDEKTISHLLLQGEIFEIKPGRLKVLD